MAFQQFTPFTSSVDPVAFKDGYAGQLIAQASGTTPAATSPAPAATETRPATTWTPVPPATTAAAGDAPSGAVLPNFNDPASIWGAMTPDEQRAYLPGMFAAAITNQGQLERDQRADARTDRERQTAIDLLNQQQENQRSAFYEALPFKNKQLQYEAMGKLFSRPTNYQVTQVPVTLAPFQNSLYRVSPGMSMDPRVG
jgi:hypothetical protein